MRITGRPPEQSGPFLRLVGRIARRKTKQITGRETERMIEPMNAYALLPRLLFAYGALEDATSKLHSVPERIKTLAELKAATLTNCDSKRPPAIVPTPVTVESIARPFTRR